SNARKIISIVISQTPHLFAVELPLRFGLLFFASFPLMCCLMIIVSLEEKVRVHYLQLIARRSDRNWCPPFAINCTAKVSWARVHFLQLLAPTASDPLHLLFRIRNRRPRAPVASGRNFDGASEAACVGL